MKLRGLLCILAMYLSVGFLFPEPIWASGIKEEVPAKYRARFEKWKAEFLATEIGRLQWNNYANNPNFELKIKVTGDRGKGAGTDRYVWDDKGNFVGATITLGAEIDQGFPNPVYYPVLNSLSTVASQFLINGNVLAATKISHEIGHVNQTAKANRRVVELQDRLMPVYVSIFLKNGLNTKDQKLVELAGQMGGTPVEIWESREYWSEVNAMLYIRERISNEESFCHVAGRIKQNLTTYAREYEQRFEQFPEISRSPCWK